MPAGKTLRIETLASAVVRWSADGWRTAHDTETQDTGLGVHVADLPTEALTQGAQIVFTFHWPEADRWGGEDFTLQIFAHASSL
jgi:glucoamylase